MVRNFREAVLKIRGQNNLIHELFNRMLPQYAKVIPGLGLKAADVQDGCHLAIADEKQLAAYEDYLKSLDGKDTHIHRLWARDFWINSGVSP
jgi:hypothetical protein